MVEHPVLRSIVENIALRKCLAKYFTVHSRQQLCSLRRDPAMSVPQPQAKRRAARRNTNVPGQALGYSLQFTRMTHLLLTSPEGSLVSFEVLDDVAVESQDGEKQLIQSKSALTANPIADRAVPLWKTLANWADLVSGQLLDHAKLRLIIYISRHCDGEIARSFAQATTRESAIVAIETARAELVNASDEVQPHIDRFFNADQKVIISVVLAFEIECGSGSPHSDLESEIRGRFIPDGRVDVVATMACGWVKRKVDKLLEQQQSAIIARDEFHKEMIPLVRKHVERALLHSFSPAPTPEQTASILPQTFVQQLQIIEKDWEDQVDAVSNYFRAAADRTTWGQTGDIDPSSLDELDKTLAATWKNLKTIAHLQTQHGSVAKGQLLLAECMCFQTALEGLQVPTHFIPGCFHLLADELKIGWHPDFLNELKKRKNAPTE
jgi:hypothetical protein